MQARAIQDQTPGGAAGSISGHLDAFIQGTGRDSKRKATLPHKTLRSWSPWSLHLDRTALNLNARNGQLVARWAVGVATRDASGINLEFAGLLRPYLRGNTVLVFPQKHACLRRSFLQLFSCYFSTIQ